MIASNEDLEALLARLNRSFEAAGTSGVYLVNMGPGQPPCALTISRPVLAIQAQVGPAPAVGARGSEQLLRRLLELNASGLLHAAFAIESEQIMLTAALELENLDLNELEAVLADVDMALSEHVSSLVELSKEGS
jgi:hypothetical protein